MSSIRGTHSLRQGIESLEDRTLPANIIVPIVVNSAADANVRGDGIITFREAIVAVNSAYDSSLVRVDKLGVQRYNDVNLGQFTVPAGDDQIFVIRFNIPNANPNVPVTLKPATPYPAINTEATILEPREIVIDGYTQPGSAPNAAADGFNGRVMVEIDGSGIKGKTTPGLSVRNNVSEVTRSPITIRGLSIHSFPGAGIDISGGGVKYSSVRDGVVTSTNESLVTIAGNLIGLTGGNGFAAKPNGVGIVTSKASHAVIGGPAAADRNVIANNKGDGIQIENQTPIPDLTLGDEVLATFFTRVVVENNLIGVLPTGDGGGNREDGVAVSKSEYVQIKNNVIGNNLGNGISVVDVRDPARRWKLFTSTRIEGNTIGLAADGKTAAGNGHNGVVLTNTTNAVVTGNVISSNGAFGGTWNGIMVRWRKAGSGGFPTWNTVITDNTIGLDKGRTLARGNSGNGIFLTGEQRIEGEDPEFRVVKTKITDNFIAGNKRFGVSSGNWWGIDVDDNVMDKTGDGKALPNGLGSMSLRDTERIEVTGNVVGNRVILSGVTETAVTGNTIAAADGVTGSGLTIKYDSTGVVLDGNSVSGFPGGGIVAVAPAVAGPFLALLPNEIVQSPNPGVRIGGDLAGQFTIGRAGEAATVVVGGSYRQTGGTAVFDVGFGSDYDRVRVSGRVALGGGLALNALPGFAPVSGAVYTLIDQAGTSKVVGTFAGLPEGAEVLIGGVRYSISYTGGDGNDVTLTLSNSYSTVDLFDTGVDDSHNALPDSGTLPVSGLESTGVGTDGQPLPHLTLDPTFTVTAAPSGYTGAVKVLTSAGGFPVGPWVGDAAGSAWVVPAQADDDGTAPAGEYTFTTTLTVNAGSGWVLSGRWAADNSARILVNGVDTGVVLAGSESFYALTRFDLPASLFTVGTNTIDFVVTNGGTDPNPVGLRVEWDLSPAAVDPHFTVTGPDGATQAAKVVREDGYPTPPWLPNTAATRWISPYSSDADGNAPPGEYVYRTTFDLAGRDAATAVLTGLWAADNFGVDIRLNGVSLGLTHGGENPGTGVEGFRSLSSFTVAAEAGAAFQAGVNVLEFVVRNDRYSANDPTPNPVGLFVADLLLFAVPVA